MYKNYVSGEEVDKKKLTKTQTKKVACQLKQEGTKLDSQLRSLSKEHQFKLDSLDSETVKVRNKADELRENEQWRRRDVARAPMRNSLSDVARRRNSVDVTSKRHNDDDGGSDITGTNINALRSLQITTSTDSKVEKQPASRGRRMSLPIIQMMSQGDPDAVPDWKTESSFKSKPVKKNSSRLLATILDNEEDMDSLTLKEGRRRNRRASKSHMDKISELSRDLEIFREYHSGGRNATRVGRRHSLAVLPSFGAPVAREQKDIFKEVRNCRYLRIPGRVESDELDMDEIFGRKQKD